MPQVPQSETGSLAQGWSGGGSAPPSVSSHTDLTRQLSQAEPAALATHLGQATCLKQHCKFHVAEEKSETQGCASQ